MHFHKPGYIRFQPTPTHFLLLVYTFCAFTGESERSSISNMDRGKAVIPFCHFCVVQWYRPFLSQFACDDSGLHMISVSRTGSPVYRNSKATLRSACFASSLVQFYNTTFRGPRQAFFATFLQKLCTCHSFFMPSTDHMIVLCRNIHVQIFTHSARCAAVPWMQKRDAVRATGGVLSFQHMREGSSSAYSLHR